MLSNFIERLKAKQDLKRQLKNLEMEKEYFYIYGGNINEFKKLCSDIIEIKSLIRKLK